MIRLKYVEDLFCCAVVRVTLLWEAAATVAASSLPRITLQMNKMIDIVHFVSQWFSCFGGPVCIIFNISIFNGYSQIR